VQRDAGVLNGAGDFGADWPEYRWEASAVGADHGLSELTVSVTWSERGQPRSAEISTLVYPSTGGLP
jgi:hypothetical protein